MMKNRFKEVKVESSRRVFLKSAGGGILYLSATCFFPSITSCKEETGQIARIEDEKGKTINIWIQIHKNDRISIFNPSAEMGQGTMTALAVIIAEHMDAQWDQIQIGYAPVEPEIYGALRWGAKSMNTDSSLTVTSYYDLLSQAGAQARYILLANAADHWDVPIEELSTEPNTVLHKESNRHISYGEIAAFLKPMDDVPEIPSTQLKNPNEFRLIGKLGSRYDIPSKVNGAAKYAIDVKVAEMAFGVISRAPVNGASPQLINEDAIRKEEGVLDVVSLEHGIGIVASSFHAALKAKNNLKIEWNDDVKAKSHSSAEAYDDYDKEFENQSHDINIIESTGNIDNAFKNTSKTYLSEYKNDYIYHAQMEPLNATVAISSDNLSAEIWTGTQSPMDARQGVAEMLEVDVSNVKLHRQYLGGGFGRRGESGFVLEAAQLAKATRRPIKLIWTREDDLQYGMFRPMSLHRLQAGIDHSGKITAWQHTIVGAGDWLQYVGQKIPFYEIPNQKLALCNLDHGVRTWYLRGVGQGPNKFAIESFIDEIAQSQNVDACQFRLDLMGDHTRAKNVLQKAADMSDWKAKLIENRAKGLAFAECAGSLAACVCEISLDIESGEIKVHRTWVALDAGVVIQVDNVVSQIEGGVLMGISNVLKESITFRNGEVEQSNFHDYPILRMNEVPDEIKVNIIQSSEPPSGIGEIANPLLGGAIANAFASLTGKRLRHMPFTPEKVLEVLKS